jgi:hypothetical protein
MVGGIGESGVIPRTLLEVFDRVRWYSGFCVASRTPFTFDRERFARALNRFPADFQAEVAGAASDWLEGGALAEATSAYRCNEDWWPVSEYYLGSQVRR